MSDPDPSVAPAAEVVPEQRLSADAPSESAASASTAPAAAVSDDSAVHKPDSSTDPSEPIDMTTMDFTDAAAAGGSSAFEPPKDRDAATAHKATGNK